MAGVVPSATAGGSSSNRSASSLVDSLFQPSLDGMIKSLRSAPGGESALIPRFLSEIRREIRSTDNDTKGAALQKLTYLSSIYSIDMAWAAFHALELLPSPNPALKRSAFLAASLCFHPSSTDLLPLATHQLRKDLQSPKFSFSVPALHLLVLSSSSDLALHLSDDLLSLLSSSHTTPHVRRCAAAASLAIIRLVPNYAHGFLPKLIEVLGPSSPLLSAAAGVFCELVSSGDPRAYLPLAPDFHRVLLECRDNWVLIKILKIFARLTPLEPRLSRKLVDPICDLMRRSSAKSLVFECIRTVFFGFPEQEAAVRLAVEKLKEFVAADDDSNLRYLGLQAMTILRKDQSWVVEENREAIVKSLADSDPNIRGEALRLIMSMVFENNIVDISAVLVHYALRSDPEFCNEILEAILFTCGRNFYELVIDFDWYVSLLGEMVRNPHFIKGDEVERQLIDIGLRVKDARLELVRVARDLLIDPALLGNNHLHRVLSAAAWISGEYIKFSKNPLEILEALLQPRISLLPSHVRAVYIQAVFKVMGFCIISYVNVHIASDSSHDVDKNAGSESLDAFEGDTSKPNSPVGLSRMKELLTSKSITYILNLIVTALAPFSECEEVEVQERACNVLGWIHMLDGVEWKTEDGEWSKDSKIMDISKIMAGVFSEELGPVSVNAQKRIPVPEGLELKENLSDLVLILGKDYIPPLPTISISLQKPFHSEDKETELTTESTSLLAEHRKRHGLYYLPTDKGENGSNEYPRANDSTLSVNLDNTEELLKLTDQSLAPRKTKPSKARPTVVKFNEDDDLTTYSRHLKEKKEGLLTGAVRDVLLFGEEKPSSSQKILSEESAEKMVLEISASSIADSLHKEDFAVGEVEHKISNSRKSKHHSHGKERHRHHRKSEDIEDKIHSTTKRGSHHHGRHKHMQKGESRNALLDVAPHTQVVQDLLL
ncbi:hypothetical protein HPP92_023134 [Vanilla planifolia]|uniref:AP-3 complex subunit delta n=1 Tax=Vanilla planifolia TaxID=51239 RepID=A0A835PXW0_VANPL|nr:hypothetical protein HPP92_023134 [Vanilla planifolia]